MKFNILYIVWAIALAGAFYIARHLSRQSGYVFFGTAESEERIIKYDFPVEVLSINVEPGKQVQMGDTLGLLYRSDIDKKLAEKTNAIQQLEAERDAKHNAIDNEMALLNARNTSKISELQAEIQLVKTEAQLQTKVKEAIGQAVDWPVTSTAPSNLKTAKILAMEEAIRQLKEPLEQELRQLKNQQNANQNLYALQVAQLTREIDYLNAEKKQLVVVAPIAGFIEQITVAKGEMVSSYSSLFKISPQKPNRIRGFIQESIDGTFHLGDTVQLASAVRPEYSLSGVVIAVSPQLIELPTRLRKFPEVKAWGREVYIQIPEANEFFLEEKVLITINPNQIK